MREGARTCAPRGKGMQRVARCIYTYGGGDGVTAREILQAQHGGRTVSGPDVRYCSANGFKAPRLVFPRTTAYPQARLLWLMHFAWVLDPICMRHARKSGTKLNCRYIVPQDVGPGDTNKSPWKSCRHNRRTFAERLNSLESARALVFFSFMHVIYAVSQTFPQFGFVFGVKSRSALNSNVHRQWLLHNFFLFDESDVSALWSM